MQCILICLDGFCVLNTVFCFVSLLLKEGPLGCSEKFSMKFPLVNMHNIFQGGPTVFLKAAKLDKLMHF